MTLMQRAITLLCGVVALFHLIQLRKGGGYAPAPTVSWDMLKLRSLHHQLQGRKTTQEQRIYMRQPNLSNNDIMWDILVDIFSGYPSLSTDAHVSSFVGSYNEHDGVEVEYNFSHDNWTLVLCYLHRFYPETRKIVPLFGHHTKHPMRFIDFLWMKYPILYPLILITIIDMAVRHLIIRRKTVSGEYHTSGLLLDYYVFYAYDRTIAMWLLTLMMRTMFDSWDEVFEKYHGNPTHYNYKVLKTWRESDDFL